MSPCSSHSCFSSSSTGFSSNQQTDKQTDRPHTHTRQARRPSPYLGDELEEGIGVESSNRQSYEVEEQPLVKGLLHEGHHAGSHQGAEGDDGHAEETVTPDCSVRANPTPVTPQRAGESREINTGQQRSESTPEREGGREEKRGHSLVISYQSGIGSGRPEANLVQDGSGTLTCQPLWGGQDRGCNTTGNVNQWS